MLLKGTLYITNDMNVIRNVMTTHKIVVIGDKEENINVLSIPGTVPGSILLPPYEAAMAQLDNNVEVFGQIYYSYLSSPDVQGFIAAILKALEYGINIVLYLSPNESQMLYSKVFMEYMKSFGIIIGTSQNDFIYDPAADWLVCSMMYIYLNNVTEEEFFLSYPQGAPIPENVCMKLIQRMNPYIEDKSLQGYMKYFFEYKERIKQNNNQYLFQPIQLDRR